MHLTGLEKVQKCYYASMKGYVANIKEKALNNEYFREVLYTNTSLQLVIMNINPGDDIGEEVHNLEQFIRIEQGSGSAVLDGVEYKIEAGAAIIVPKGTRHNIINTSSFESLKLLTLYAPPDHKDKTIHKSKTEAEYDTNDHFDGVTSD